MSGPLWSVVTIQILSMAVLLRQLLLYARLVRRFSRREDYEKPTNEDTLITVSAVFIGAVASVAGDYLISQ